MRYRILFITLVLNMLLVTTSWASPAMLFDTIRNKNKEISTLRIDFIQSSKLVLFDSPLEVYGTLTLEKPQNLRWEYTAPSQSGFIIHADGGMQWSKTEADGIVKRSDLSPALQVLAQQILLWVNVDEETLANDFFYEIDEQKTPVITLQPKSKAMQGFIKSIVIVLPETLQGVQKITVTEANNSVVTLTFDTPQINPKLTESTFTTP